MTFDELRTELAARGFNHLSDTRLGQFVNQARAELDGLELWPYREDSSTGSSPLSITDLVVVEQVVDVDTGRVLIPSDFDSLIETYEDLTTAGTPEFFYIGTPSGVPTVATYPVGTGDIEVQYYRRTAVLSADADEPAAPVEYHMLICDMAQYRALANSDEIGTREGLRVSIDRDIQRMRQELLVQHLSGINQRVTFSSEDW